MPHLMTVDNGQASSLMEIITDEWLLMETVFNESSTIIDFRSKSIKGSIGWANKCIFSAISTVNIFVTFNQNQIITLLNHKTSAKENLMIHYNFTQNNWLWFSHTQYNNIFITLVVQVWKLTETLWDELIQKMPVLMLSMYSECFPVDTLGFPFCDRHVARVIHIRGNKRNPGKMVEIPQTTFQMHFLKWKYFFQSNILGVCFRGPALFWIIVLETSSYQNRRRFASHPYIHVARYQWSF